MLYMLLNTSVDALQADLNGFSEAAEPGIRFLAMLVGQFYPILHLVKERLVSINCVVLSIRLPIYMLGIFLLDKLLGTENYLSDNTIITW